MSSDDTFVALLAEKHADQVEVGLKLIRPEELPDGDVLVQVEWSGINYKDALAVTNRGRIIRRFPMVPGIDLAGTVIQSDSPHFSAGDQVLVTGYGIGEEHWGGYSQLARLRSSWLVPLPPPLTTSSAMALGTAGFTAALSVLALEAHGLTPGQGEVIVTGATGGLGSVAVALLSRAGHQVVASTGRPELADYLKQLGAGSILARAELATPSSRPMGSERWSGAVDAVGGPTLANLIRTTRRHGSIAACGLAGGAELSTTVYPFILRGVNLLGIDSNYCPYQLRLAAWQRLARDLPLSLIETTVDRRISLEEVPSACQMLLAGQIRGRVLVDLGRQPEPPT